MRFHVNGIAECYKCPGLGRDAIKIVTDSEVEAESTEDAVERFQDKNRLCPDCKTAGINTPLNFIPLTISVHLVKTQAI